jgi:hypothetical protein
MKKYNLYPTKKEFKWGTMDVLALGEKGRGRHQSLVPWHVPEGSEYVGIGTTRTNRPKIVKSDDPTGWLAYISSAGVYTRGTYGRIYYHRVQAL